MTLFIAVAFVLFGRIANMRAALYRAALTSSSAATVAQFRDTRILTLLFVGFERAVF